MGSAWRVLLGFCTLRAPASVPVKVFFLGSSCQRVVLASEAETMGAPKG